MSQPRIAPRADSARQFVIEHACPGSTISDRQRGEKLLAILPFAVWVDPEPHRGRFCDCGADEFYILPDSLAAFEDAAGSEHIGSRNRWVCVNSGHFIE